MNLWIYAVFPHIPPFAPEFSDVLAGLPLFHGFRIPVRAANPNVSNKAFL